MNFYFVSPISSKSIPSEISFLYQRRDSFELLNTINLQCKKLKIFNWYRWEWFRSSTQTPMLIVIKISIIEKFILVGRNK